MEVVLAKHAGFCFGVKRAVEGVYELIDKGKQIYTYGPIIHNEEVVSDLESKGVKVIETLEELKDLKDSTVVIRAHGVPKSIYDLLKENNNECIDLTCPFVKRIHDIVYEKSMEGYKILIVGSEGHPEVLGIMGWANQMASVVENKEEAIAFELKEDIPLCIVSQTTYNLKKFEELVDIIEKKGYNAIVVNTICNATKERQESAGEIASQVDVMLVIGGRNSSNTQKLYDICHSHCERTYYIQTVEDLKFDLPKAASLVGITAGASTPNKIIEEVQNYVRINF